MATTTRIGTFFGQSPVISADGNYIAYVSTNMDFPSETNHGSNVILENLVTKQFYYMSTSSSGVLGNDFSSLFESPAISANGRFVAFESDATNLVPGDTNGERDLFIKNFVTATTTRISLDANGNQLPANTLQDIYRPSISADGRYVAFQSTAALTGAGAAGGSLADGNVGPNIFLRDTVAGTTSIVSANSSGVRVSGSSPSISADGRYIAFESLADNLVGNISPFDDHYNVFVYDRLTHTTRLASISISGQQTGGNGDSEDPVMSPDGRSVVFSSTASNLVPNDTNGVADIFKYDLQSGTITRLSLDSRGNQANGASGIGFGKAAVSGDGRYVVFQSDANNLVPGDTNNALDVFVRDTVANTTTRVSVNSNGEEPVGGYLGTKSYDGSISADGSKIVFMSNGKNMNDAGIDTPQIYLRDLGSGSNGLSAPSSTATSPASQPDILTGIGKETLVGTSGVNYFTFQTRKASTLRSLTRIENFNQPEGDRLVVGSTPKALYNAGKIRASNLLDAAKAAYRDKNKRQSGNQALKRNEAVLFRYKSSSYLSINNKSGGFAPRQDFLVSLTTPVLSAGDNKPGFLSVSNYFA